MESLIGRAGTQTHGREISAIGRTFGADARRRRKASGARWRTSYTRRMDGPPSQQRQRTRSHTQPSGQGDFLSAHQLRVRHMRDDPLGCSLEGRARCSLILNAASSELEWLGFRSSYIRFFLLMPFLDWLVMGRGRQDSMATAGKVDALIIVYLPLVCTAKTAAISFYLYVKINIATTTKRNLVLSTNTMLFLVPRVTKSTKKNLPDIAQRPIYSIEYRLEFTYTVRGRGPCEEMPSGAAFSALSSRKSPSPDFT